MSRNPRFACNTNACVRNALYIPRRFTGMGRVVEIAPETARQRLENAGASFGDGREDEAWRARHGGSVVAAHRNGVVVYGDTDKIEAVLADGGGSGTVYFDGASRGNPGPASIAYVVVDDGVVKKHGERIGEATNNEAEYQALLAGLEAAKDLGYSAVEAVGDSELVVRQVDGEWSVNAENLAPLHRRVREVVEEFESFGIRHVPREANSEADALANQALDR